MHKIIIACDIFTKEIELIQKKHHLNYPVIYLSSTLHVNSDKLRKELQKVIHYLKIADQIVLCYGRCGNGLVGIRAEWCPLSITKFQDCIGILLSGNNDSLINETDNYYFSNGWVNSKSGIIKEYERCCLRYDDQTVREIFSSMLRHYQKSIYVDTGVSTKKMYRKAVLFSLQLGLEFHTIQSNLELLEKLIIGKHTDAIVKIEQGQRIDYKIFD